MTGVNEQLPFVVDLITAEPEVRYTFRHDMDGKIGNLKTFSVYSFFEHIEAGDTSSVRLFIENGMDVNARYGDGDTALLRAAWRGEWAVVRLLVEHGADVNAQNNNGDTALSFAKLSGSQEIVDLLEAAGATE